MVLDASAVLEWLLQTALGIQVDTHLSTLREPLSAPHILDLEVCQVLRRLVREGKLSEQRAEQALADYQELPLERYPHLELLSRIWELRANVSAYDAAYLTLAEALDVELLTCDRKLATVPGSRAAVTVVG